jgi:hypothetical protein
MGDSIHWIILGVCAFFIVWSFLSVGGSKKSMNASLAQQEEARQRGEKLLASVAETNQLLRELIAEVRSKR